MRLRALGPLVAVALFARNSRAADPELLRCDGSDATRAKSELDGGLAGYRAALANAEIDETQMTSAVTAFEAACRDGDAMALLWRTFALIALRKKEDAALSLAAFLAAKPFHELGDDDKKRITDAATVLNSADTSVKFGMVNVTSNVPAQIYVGASGSDRLLGTTPLSTMVAGNRVTVKAVAPDHESDVRSFDTGDLRPVILDFQLVAIVPVSPPSTEQPSGRAHSKGPIFLGIGAGVAALVGVGGAIWRANRVSVYNGACPDDTSTASGPCASTLSQFHAAEGVEIGGFIAAGVLVAGTATWWYVDDRASKRSATASCTLGGCALRVTF